MCVMKGMLVHCYVVYFLLQMFVCVGRDVSSLFCDVVLNVIPIYVCQINDLIFRIIRLG